MRQAVSHTGFNLRQALLWAVIILALTGSGIGIAYWMGRKVNNPPPALPAEIKPQPAPSNPAVRPEFTVKKEAPSVAAPYFTENMNKEIDKFRMEREKAALDQQQLKNLSNNTEQELRRKKQEINERIALRNMNKVMDEHKELDRMAIAEKIADPATAREYAMENQVKYSVRPLLEEPPPPPEPPPVPYPPMPQEPSLIGELWRDITGSIRDILRSFFKK